MGVGYLMSTNRKLTRSIIAAAALIVAGISMLLTVAFATAPQPVSWSYPALQGLCLLEAGAAVDGVEAAYPIGHVANTKSGKWVCTEAIARQTPVALAGVWIRAK